MLNRAKCFISLLQQWLHVVHKTHQASSACGFSYGQTACYERPSIALVIDRYTSHRQQIPTNSFVSHKNWNIRKKPLKCAQFYSLESAVFWCWTRTTDEGFDVEVTTRSVKIFKRFCPGMVARFNATFYSTGYTIYHLLKG